MAMVSRNLGVREVKTNLSGLLKKVKEGQEIIITDRGKPIGKIVPFPAKELSLEDRIRHLENQGLLDPLSKKAGRRLPSPLPAPAGLAQRYLQEGRNR
ncbi:MAG: type II toxin-antitoxin system prevent-host-death family antitoxin [Desulfobacca sp.]|nr:type II toxin-antitoxin system prevent-host-death family antitoxin [Desulfobacca sp.]